MEKFVIQGGSPLSGEIVAAGNKNAALPILAACLLTEEELVLAQRAADPRHRDADRAARAARRRASSGAARTSSACRPTRSPRPRSTRSSRRGSAPRSCSPARCWPASARRAMPPPGRRLHRPPPPRPAPRRLPRPRRRGRGRPLDRDHRAAGRAASLRDLHGRAVGDGDRERADGRRADPGPDDDRATPPASRTSRTSPACWSRWARRSTGSART